MLRLHTLGGVYVATESGERLGGAASQRRLLALLTLLAVSGEGGLSRDKIVGLLWPESDADRARHSLTQALYAARRALGRDDLFVVDSDVRINVEALTSDVAELERLLGAGEIEAAVALYHGSFLDGFFLGGAPEFEHWVSMQRTRLDDRVATALEQLAVEADAAGTPRRAAEWWRRVAAIRPLDSRPALALMQALASAGDRAAALQHARVHESLLRSQLELGPDPAVLALAERLREPVATEDAALSFAEAAGDEAAAVEDAVAASAVATPAVATAPDGVAVQRSRTITVQGDRPVDILVSRRGARRRLLQAAMSAILVALLLAAGALIGRRIRPRPQVERLPQPQQVVVAPFRVAGASASLRYLREGFVELLSTRLADDSTARSVDAGAVLGAWRLAGLPDAVDVSRDTVVALAGQLGAERVVIGNIVGTPAHLIVNASVVSVTGKTITAQATVEGSVDSLTTLVDELARRLLLSEAGEDAALAAHTSRSLPALRAFLSGRAAFRASRLMAALSAYDRALRLDSTFALAALDLALGAEELNDAERLREAVGRAWRYRGELGSRDAARLGSLAGTRYPAPSPIVARRAAWQQEVDLEPNSAEAWYDLATRMLQSGRAAGVRDAAQRAEAAYRRALAIDPSHAGARRGILLLSPVGPAGGDASPTRARGSAFDTLGGFAPYVRWRVALAEGDASALAVARDSFPWWGLANLRALLATSLESGVGIDDAALAVAALRSRAGSTSDRVNAVLAEHALAANRGQPSVARSATNELERLRPSSHAHLRLRVLDAIYGDGDSLTANGAARRLGELLGTPAAPAGGDAATRQADACVLAQWRLGLGDAPSARAWADWLQAQEPAWVVPPIAAQAGACAALLEAGLAVRARARDARTRVARVDSLLLDVPTAGDLAMYANIALSRLYLQLGQVEAALEAIRRRPRYLGWPRYLASSLREEGRIAERLGDRTSADAAYAGFLARRDEAEGPLRQEVERLRARRGGTVPSESNAGSRR